jgi:cell wall-associated NlpC family hydrolase
MRALKSPCAVRTPDQERQAVVQEARTWLGTPYHHMARIKKAGVDCAMLLAEVYERAGIIDHLAVEPYSMQWHLHRDDERLIGIVEQYASVTETPQIGDVVLFRFGRAHSHAGIIVGDGGEIIHAVVDIGVTLDSYERNADLWQRKKIFYSAW